MNLKHVREVARLLKRDMPGLVFEQVRQERHCIVRVEWRGKEITVPIASTPTNVDHTIWNAVREIKRGLK